MMSYDIEFSDEMTQAVEYVNRAAGHGIPYDPRYGYVYEVRVDGRPWAARYNLDGLLSMTDEPGGFGWFCPDDNEQYNPRLNQHEGQGIKKLWVSTGGLGIHGLPDRETWAALQEVVNQRPTSERVNFVLSTDEVKTVMSAHDEGNGWVYLIYANRLTWLVIDGPDTVCRLIHVSMPCQVVPEKHEVNDKRPFIVGYRLALIKSALVWGRGASIDASLKQARPGQARPSLVTTLSQSNHGPALDAIVSSRSFVIPLRHWITKAVGLKSYEELYHLGRLEVNRSIGEGEPLPF